MGDIIMDKPLISYVVTTHNIEKYVRESVYSKIKVPQIGK